MSANDSSSNLNPRHGEFSSPSKWFQRLAPAVGLFLLSPLVAEFLLGNIAIDAIWVLMLVAPLYGGGALLVREIARRSGRGWPTIVLLAMAYAVIEEGLVTQSLFNPSYFGFDLLSATHVPGLKIGAWWTLYVLTIHTVWSIAIPIALVESLVPRQATQPWLGTLGTTIAAALFLAGAALNFYTTFNQERFLATAPQAIGAAVVSVALIGAAFAVGRKRFPSADHPAPAERLAPSPWLVGAASLLATSLFSLGLYLPLWPTVGVWLALFIGSAVVIVRWSRRAGWGMAHRLALAGGGLLTYAWQGFPHAPIMGSSGTIDLIGNAVFALGAIGLLIAAARAVRRVR